MEPDVWLAVNQLTQRANISAQILCTISLGGGGGLSLGPGSPRHSKFIIQLALSFVDAEGFLVSRICPSNWYQM